MRIGDRRCLVCDCEGTMPLDPARLAHALGTAEPAVHHQLCRRQLDAVRAVAGEPLLIGCTQETAVLGEVAAEALFVNIRERAGWSNDAARATPKIAALFAEALVPIAPATTVTMRSEGRCLVLGRGEKALETALRLAERLTVTLLLEAGDDLLPPARVEFPILFGEVAGATGHLGAFAVEVSGLAPAAVSARDHLHPGVAQKRGRLDADLILDLRGATPLFAAHVRRDGYLRAEPSDAVAVERALFEATGLVGEFEKPRHVMLDAALCAHSRSRRTGCTRCLEQCPTGAIVPAGDHVAIDAFICAGCGACSGVCPTGAASYASPSPAVLLTRLRALLGTFRSAGGNDPVLLIHEFRHGGGLIDAIARRGRGLPARVLPLAVEEIAQLGFEHLAAAAAYGAMDVLVLVPQSKRAEIAGLEATLGYVRAVLDGLGHAGERLRLVIEDDPDGLEDLLWGLPVRTLVAVGDFLPLGGKRALMRAALDQLHRTAPAPVDQVELPEGAPFGALRIDVAGCTLCLACVGACPTGALLDNPERPMLRFIEDACVQCGLCRSTCPEKVIALQPRIDFTLEARTPRLVKEEEPAQCTRCGKAFGTKSSIERIVAKLSGRNPLFQTPEQVALIRMCDDCRVKVQFETKDNPFQLGTVRRPRTSEDYLRDRSEPKPEEA
jgi:ferredoxin